ncbi:alpha-mannosidase [Paenibacillus sp. HB172176]|uniref:alpha-mannosidase n=1 Tax=Paenibacillus sp. HB172176 TaxID=2493690 RepID=UPI001439C452|nr:alpha-mannosidase [Paenibacillus sp. HB172176]
MLLTYEKILKRVEELQPYRYRDAIRLQALQLQMDEGEEVGAYPPDGGEWSSIHAGEDWSGYDQYAWLRANVRIPSEWSDRKVLGLFDFGQTGGGNNSGFESLLFVNGQPYQGVDGNHKEVFFGGELAGEHVQLAFRLWSGLGGYDTSRNELRHSIRDARICWLDEAADDLYFTARAVIQTVGLLSEHQPEKHLLLSLVNKAFLGLDWSSPGSQAFYDSVDAARQCLREGLQQEQKASAVVVRCIGHTHIDVAWLWRLSHTREKAARSFSTVLKLMEQYPEYIFLQTQPQLYEYIKQDYPDIYTKIKSRIGEGRWEAGGAMWLEADCNLSSGESLVRQILYGTRFLKEEFGADCTYLWLPDVFGYSWALPQILRKSGITMFMTTKISWNQYNRMPHDTFRWRGIDGSEVLTHFITTPDPGAGEGAFYYTYNGGITPFSVKGIWEAYQDKNVNRKLLLAYGYGDGGGGVNREMLEMRRRLADIPGLPQVETGRADEYFAELEQTVESSEEYIHTWDGELYLELHRGTYTSQAYNKRMNRKLELLLRETEWLEVLAGAMTGQEAESGQAADSGQGKGPSQSLQEAWKIVLRNQFHDIIPGSSIREVYEDCRVEYAEAERLAREVWQAAGERLTKGLWLEPGAELASGQLRPEPGAVFAKESWREGGKQAAEDLEHGAFTLFNSSSWSRTELVEIPADDTSEGDVKGFPASEDTAWMTACGKTCRSQSTESGWLIEVPDLPPMGFLTLVPSMDDGGRETATAEFASSLDGVETPHYIIQWDSSGRLTRIYDKQVQREVLAAGEFGNELQVFEDKPKSRHEAWDIDIFYTEKQRRVEDCRGIRVKESGPLRMIVEFAWKYGSSTIVQEMKLYSYSRRIDFETKADWHEQRQLLKVAFPVAVRSTEATYDIQFGNVKRPTHWNTSWDYARFETVGHQWADLSERDYGVSLLNDCKYGYDIKGHVMRLSLIKSAMVPDPTADQGEHVFTYSLLPHSGDWFEGGTAQEAWSLNNPVSVSPGASSLQSGSLLRLSASHVMIDAVKRAEDGDGIIVRAHEFAGKRGQLALEVGFPVLTWQETDLLERPVGEAMTGVLQGDILPYEIKTWRIRPQTDKR